MRWLYLLGAVVKGNRYFWFCAYCVGSISLSLRTALTLFFKIAILTNSNRFLKKQMDFSLTKEQFTLQEKARNLAQEWVAPRAAKWDETETYPHENVEKLVEAGFMGMTIPRKYGGLGASLLDALLVVEEMAKVCGATGRIVVEANMGALGIILCYGSEALKSFCTNLVLAGDKPVIAISEPEAGTDASSMVTHARLENDEWVLNGDKIWITGGGVSQVNVVFAQIDAESERPHIGAFMVKKGSAGFEVGRRSPMMGLRAIPETELHLRNCRVPAGNLLAKGIGRLMAAYNAQRLGAGTVALGVAQGAYELALGYAKERHQFKRPIAEFQGLRWMMADCRIRLDSARLLLHRAASDLEPNTGFPRRDYAALAKAAAGETAIYVSNEALQIFGAKGYSRDYPLERMVRDARMFTIGGGTIQALRNVIGDEIFGQKISQTR